MKCLVYIAIALLALAPTAFGAVGTVEQSGGSGYTDFARSYQIDPPSLRGPYEEGYSPTELKFVTPEMYSFPPDEKLSFGQATPPPSVLAAFQGASQTGPSSWYWPGSVESQNKLYVQTRDGVTTVAGCSSGGYLPLWAKVAYTGNFFVYEWYPNRLAPSVNWYFWTWPGYLKGWFKGDEPGWHVLCFHSDKSSNYVYIYVWPESGSATTGKTGLYGGEKTAIYPKIEAPQTRPASSSLTSGVLTAGAGMATPTPPDPVSEGLMPTDLRLPALDYAASGYEGWTAPLPAGIASGSGISDYGGYSLAASGYGGFGPGVISPPGFSPGVDTVSDFGLVYTPKSVSKYNEYYVQTKPGRLTTVASTRQNQWLSLWSKINRPGMYWSFEWPPCKAGYYCPPEIKSFGYKKAGWHPTWFKSSTPGWHLLVYQCNDWSNYVYIYVWP